MEEVEAGNELDIWHNQNKLRIEVDKIGDLLPGLETYQQPDEKSVKNYIYESNPIHIKNNVIFLLLYLFCFTANLYSVVA